MSGAAASRQRIGARWVAGGLAGAAAAVALFLVVSQIRDETTASDTGVDAARLASETTSAEQDALLLLAERPRLGEGIAIVVSDTRRLEKGAGLPEETIDVTEASRLDLRAADVEADKGTRLRVSLDDEGFEVLELDHGLVRAVASSDATDALFAVRTKHGRAEVMGTRFEVLAEPETTKVRVVSGKVRVHPAFAPALTLGAGESVVLPLEQDPQEEAAVDPPEIHRPAHTTETVKPHTVHPKSSEPPSPDERLTEAAALEEARAAVDTDPDLAARIVTSILDEPLAPRDEVTALAILADAKRRSGAPLEAASLYQRVADHTEGAGFAEEALMQLALIHIDAGKGSKALSIIEETHERVGTGVLGPERAAMAARVHLEAARPIEAADALDTVDPEQSTYEIDHLRLATADALLGTDPSRAASLAVMVIDGSAPDELKDAARAILRKARLSGGQR